MESGEKNRLIYQWVVYGVKVLGLIAICCYLIWLFETNMITDYSKRIVVPYLNISVLLGRILTIIATIVIAIKAMMVCQYKQRFRWKYVLPVTVALTMLYIRYSCWTNYFYFITEPAFNDNVSYVEIVLVEYYILLVIALGVEIYERKKNKDLQKGENADIAYLSDNPEQMDGVDELMFGQKAKKIAEEIRTLPLTNSWSIGIVGKWGSGKSTFINFITGCLPEEYAIIKFNPRMAASVSRIQEQALLTLEEHLRMYDTNLMHLLRRYMSVTKIAETNTWTRLLYGLFREPDGVEALKERLNTTLRHLPIRIVFVIEDFDRLLKEEVIEVLKLIDGNANFSNIIYMAAYDCQYVDDIFEYSKTNQHYLSKYFSIEHHVPLRPSHYILDYIVKDLTARPLRISGEGFALAPEVILKEQWKKVNSYLPTLRDAKRYLNLLRSDYAQVETEVDMEDFMLITLVKYSCVEEYEEMFFNPKKYLDLGALISYKEDSKNKHCSEILQLLFPKSSEPSRRPRRIRDNESFLTYFVAEIYGLPIGEMTTVIRQDAAASQPKIKEWIDTGKINDFINFLYYNYKWFIRNDDELYRYADICLIIVHALGGDGQLPDMRVIFTEELSKYETSSYRSSVKKRDYAKHLMERLTAVTWNRGEVRLMTRLVPSLFDKDANKYVVKAQEITSICDDQLAVQARFYRNDAEEDVFGLCMLLLTTCVEEDGKDGVKLLPNSCRIIRNMIDRNPKYYIRDFVTISDKQASGMYHVVYCEEYWRQIFGGETEFETFIGRSEYDNLPEIKRDRNFWKLYKANKFEAFRVMFDIKEVSAKQYDFSSEVEQLNTLKSYEEEMNRIAHGGYDRARSTRFKEFSNLQNRISNVPLESKYKSTLLEMVEKYKKTSVPLAQLYKY